MEGDEARREKESLRDSSLELSGYHAEETAWSLYGLEVAGLGRKMRPASKVVDALWKASQRTTSHRKKLDEPSRQVSGFGFSILYRYRAQDIVNFLCFMLYHPCLTPNMLGLVFP